MPEESLTERLARIRQELAALLMVGPHDVEWLVSTVETLYRQNCEYMALVKQGADKLETAEYALEKEKNEGKGLAREVLRLKENAERRRIDNELARSEQGRDRGVRSGGDRGGEAVVGADPEPVAGRGPALV